MYFPQLNTIGGDGITEMKNQEGRETELKQGYKPLEKVRAKKRRMKEMRKGR